MKSQRGFLVRGALERWKGLHLSRGGGGGAVAGWALGDLPGRRMAALDLTLAALFGEAQSTRGRLQLKVYTSIITRRTAGRTPQGLSSVLDYSALHDRDGGPLRMPATSRSRRRRRSRTLVRDEAGNALIICG
jgi:hypothetical protein